MFRVAIQSGNASKYAVNREPAELRRGVLILLISFA